MGISSRQGHTQRQQDAEQRAAGLPIVILVDRDHANRMGGEHEPRTNAQSLAVAGKIVHLVSGVKLKWMENFSRSRSQKCPASKKSPLRLTTTLRRTL